LTEAGLSLIINIGLLAIHDASSQLPLRCLASQGQRSPAPASTEKPNLTSSPKNIQREKETIMNGTAKYGERVVIVEVDSGRVNLKTGCISSTDSSHVEADNLNTTVVRGDRRFRPIIETPEEAHERSFNVHDIHLLKEQEAQSLEVLDAVQDWFGVIYQDLLVSKIHRALKRLKRN